MNEILKHRLHFKKGEEMERNWVYRRKPASDQVRFTEKVTTVTDSEYKLPLFQKRAWLTLLSRVWQTSHFETDNPEFPSFQGYSEFSLNLLSET